MKNLIENQTQLGSHEFLHELDKALTTELKIQYGLSQYVDIGGDRYLRLSDHYANTGHFEEHPQLNFGVVARPQKEHRRISVFVPTVGVDYVEYVFFPDKFDGKQQLKLLDGVVNFIKNGDFKRLPTPDYIHTSGEYKNVFKQGKPKHSLKEADNLYLDAVARGDMATAERMVREAAAIAPCRVGETRCVFQGNGQSGQGKVFAFG